MNKELTINAFGENRYSPVEVLEDAVLAKALKPVFINICKELKLTSEQANALVSLIWSSPREKSILAFERKLQDAVTKFVSLDDLRSALERRAFLEAQQVLPYLTGSSLADIGCGDGLVAWHLRNHIKTICLVDVCRYVDSRVALPFVQNYEGESLPLTEQVDTSLLLTVLHHAEDPVGLLHETRSITRARTLIIESIYGIDYSIHPTPLVHLDHDRQRKYATFLDWLYNRIFHDGVPVPYNFTTPYNWRRIFEASGWEVHATIDLGIDQPIVPEHHFLFVLTPT